MRSIFLGFACNNHCVFCSQGALGAASSAVAPVGVVPFSAGEEIAFVGGEPTLSEGLLDNVSLAKRSGVAWILVQTNARRLCYADYAGALSRAGVDALDVSLQGSTPAMHDYHTQVSGSMAQTVAGMRRAKEVGLPFGVSTVVTRSNFRHLAEIARLAHQLGAAAVHFERSAPYGRAAAARDRVIPAPELVAEAFSLASHEASRLGLELSLSGKQSSPAARRLFAGMGERNEAPAVPLRSAGAEVESAPRPNPGLAERHGQRKISGEGLRGIFPELFEPGQTEAHG